MSDLAFRVIFVVAGIVVVTAMFLELGHAPPPPTCTCPTKENTP